MTEGALVDRLDRIVDAVLQRGDATRALSDEELAQLVRVVADLRYCPSDVFKSRLRSGLERATKVSSAIALAHVREGLTTITPYVGVEAAGLVDFLGVVFGAVETPVAPAGAGRSSRAVRIGNSTIAIDEGGLRELVPFRPAEFHVHVDDVDAAFERALAAGATSLGPPADRPYGERAGFVRDAFGNHWFIGTPLGGAHVPEGPQTVTAFLHVEAAAQYIVFLQRAFGAIELRRHEGPEGRVIYARLRIGNAAIELGEADEPSMPGTFYLSVGDADLIYEQSLDAGATTLSPPADRSRGERLAAVKDAMGNHWLIAQTT